MYRLFFLLMIIVALSACVTPVPYNTASGKMEMTFSGLEANKIKPLLINDMVNQGYTITQSTDYLVSFDRPLNDHLSGILFGSHYNGTPNERITYTIVPVNNGTRVIADLKIVTNPNSVHERITDMNRSQESLRVQGYLTMINYQCCRENGE